MSPFAGVSAHSAGLIVTGTVVVVPGGTLTNIPWLMALDQALNLAVPGTSSTPPASRSNETAEYVSRGFELERHGSPVRHSWLDRIGSSATVESVGAAAKKAWLAPALRVLNTKAPMSPLNSPVVMAPESAPTTT